jgi:hypothetical protein
MENEKQIKSSLWSNKTKFIAFYLCITMFLLLTSVLLVTCSHKEEPLINNITLDTTAKYFIYVDKYLDRHRNKKGINKYLLYITKDDSAFHIIITALKSFDRDYPTLPLCSMKYRGNYMFLYTGIEDLLKFDSVYLKEFDTLIDYSGKPSIFDPGVWDIVFTKDTCYVRAGLDPFIKTVELPDFQRKEIKESPAARSVPKK